MWIDRLTYSRTTNALALAAQFHEQRQRVLADNLANVDTPDYVSRRLDPAAFQSALQNALDPTRSTRGATELELRGDAQVLTDSSGALRVRPVYEPAPNALFHDGTNARLEDLLADVQENALSYELATNLLRGRYGRLLQAIRGRVT